MKIKISLFKLVIIMVLTFFSGYFVRSIHYKDDVPYLEKGRVETRISQERIERQFMPLMKSAIKTIEGYEKIIDQNIKHPVIVFIKEEK